MNYKLAKWIENEFEHQTWFFSEFKSGLVASYNFINSVLKDNETLRLDEEDKKYISTILSCYSKMKKISKEMIEVIGEYKMAFSVLFADEGFISTENAYEPREITRE